MLSRRDLLMTGALVSRMSPAAAGELQRTSQSASDGPTQQDVRDIRDALLNIRRLTPSADIKEIQDRQRVHFKATQKFPTYIDIGLSVWERLTTWHLENHIPLKAERTPQGRLELEFMFTTLVLRSDIPDGLIGTPYD